ncbi:maleylpyruvate isomerase N-terminal domain-containing protein [Kitasatospora sp. NPDC101176]|uniref:maleylpyruvate isomerase N-terminal domain-containing protein n=1 Tax=Kitasatospora sp. NPDC101176 TaxID=3364099 RepID=UPI00382E2BA3
MDTILDFPALLQLIGERSDAFRAAVAAAPDLDAQVPTCPEWTLFDLAQHIGEGRRRWAATVAAGPADAPPPASVWEGAAPRGREELSQWLAESTRLLLDALGQAGPDRGCWTWWGPQSPPTSGAVARHQLQQLAVHTYDAQLAAGTGATELPEEVALDGVEDFLFTCCATTAPWPHEPCVVDYHASEGRSWRLALSAAGAHTTRLPAGGAQAGADAAAFSALGTAGQLVLALYGRIPVSDLKVEGDVRIFEQLAAWEPEV